MIRDHYFERKSNGTWIYLGSTDPIEARSEEVQMFFDGKDAIVIIQGSMMTYELDKQEATE